MSTLSLYFIAFFCHAYRCVLPFFILPSCFSISDLQVSCVGPRVPFLHCRLRRRKFLFSSWKKSVFDCLRFGPHVFSPPCTLYTSSNGIHFWSTNTLWLVSVMVLNHQANPYIHQQQLLNVWICLMTLWLLLEAGDWNFSLVVEHPILLWGPIGGGVQTILAAVGWEKKWLWLYFKASMI